MDIVLKNIKKSYNGKPVLRDFNAVIREGGRYGLHGPSGCGKTTLMRILLGLESEDSGEITGAREQRAGVVFQEDRLCEGISAEANAAIGLPKKRRLDGVFAEVGLEGCAHMPVNKMSGGMRRRVALLRALLAPGSLLILDEPFNGLDDETRLLCAHFINNHANGRTVLLVTHDEREPGMLEADTVWWQDWEKA